MKSSKIILLFSALGISMQCFSQRLVLSNDPYIVMSGGTAGTPIYIVLDNSNANAITMATAQVTGGIESESEFNMIKWNVGITTGTYTVPFTKAFGGPIIPFTANVTAAGVGAGNIKFSTYPGGNWDNFTYMPTGVTNMASAYAGGADNSEFVIDRFWIIDANGYGTKPTANLTFTYIDAEMTPAGNTIAEGNLGAQRWTGTTWDVYTPQGTWSDLGARGLVSNAPAAPTDFFRSWTLVDNTSPLPVELTAFEGKCNNEEVEISWSTASETNNNFFTLEKSTDGISYYTIATIAAHGTTSGVSNYSFNDNSPFSGGTYYRLKQTDYDGHSETFPSIYAASCIPENVTMEIFNQGENNFTLLIDQPIQEDYILTIYDALGQVILQKSIGTTSGSSKTTFPLENIRDAMYFVNINNGKDRSLTKKIIINQ